MSVKTNMLLAGEKPRAPYPADLIACDSADKYVKVLTGLTMRLFTEGRPILNLVSNNIGQSPITLRYDKRITFAGTVLDKQYGRLKEYGVDNCTPVEGTEEPAGRYQSELRVGEYNKGDWSLPCSDSFDSFDYLKEDCSNLVEMLSSHIRDLLSDAILSQLTGIQVVSLENNADTVYNTKAIRGYNELTPPTNLYALGNHVGLKKVEDGNDGPPATGTLTYDSLLMIEALAKVHNLEPIKGRDYQYVLYLHPEQVLQLQRDSDFKNMLVNSRNDYIGDNEVGVVHGVLIKSDPSVPYGMNKGAPFLGSRRGLLLGAKAASFICGGSPAKFDYTLFPWLKKPSNLALFDKAKVPVSIRWRESDYGRQLFAMLSMVFGVKKTRFDGRDYGVVAITTASKSVTSTDVKSK